MTDRHRQATEVGQRRDSITCSSTYKLDTSKESVWIAFLWLGAILRCTLGAVFVRPLFGGPFQLQDKDPGSDADGWWCLFV